MRSLRTFTERARRAMTGRIGVRMARQFAPAALLAVVLVGCSTTTPSPSPAPTAAPTAAASTPAPAPTASARPLAEVYADIRAQVEAIRGLQPTNAVEPVVIDAAQLAKNLGTEFDTSHTAAALKDAEDELIALGLLPAGTSLRAATLAFQSGQVAGYYSPEQDKLFVVSRSGALGAADESTYAHEFTHQLQDQRFGLDKLGLAAADQSDRSLARLALVEGDAVSVQTTWMTKHLTSQQLGEVMSAALDPAALKAFNNAPPYLRDTSLFPYQQGLTFVTGLLAQGQYGAVDAAFKNPPDSTEQILHPEKFLTREPPLVVKLPSDLAATVGPGWSVAGEDTLGEFLLNLWLRLGGVPSADAAAAAAGWGGDRLALLRGPDGAVQVRLFTVWDTPADADAFAAAAQVPAKGFVDHSPGDRTVSITLGDITHSTPGQPAG
jgi:hypothetical protein